MGAQSDFSLQNVLEVRSAGIKQRLKQAASKFFVDSKVVSSIEYLEIRGQFLSHACSAVSSDLSSPITRGQPGEQPEVQNGDVEIETAPLTDISGSRVLWVASHHRHVCGRLMGSRRKR